MKNVRTFVILILLAIATPIAIHYRAWSLGLPAASHTAISRSADNSGQSTTAANTVETQSATQPEPTALSPAPSSDLANSSFNLPVAGSSLPLLSVIGFGVFVGGLISALRTRPAHK
ncbi:MAG TPA: hypothetical protein VNX88_17765 [Terriglobales bacterium]|nr:hypothetical protein [Terriglobales bacterium]